MKFEQIKQLDHEHVMNTYGRYDACIVSGKGATCVDVNGKKYIDFTSGIGVNSLGFADPDWVKAVSEQAGKLAHISNLFYTTPGLEVADTLCKKTGYSRVLFGNSGAEANEGAIKTARKYSFDKYGPGRATILTLVNSFHGRTVTTLAATGQDVFHNYFFPFTEGFKHAPAGDMAAVKAADDGSLCAVMVEFVQGEGGVIPLEETFVKRLAEWCKEKDILLIADEVQTGIGRTGKLLASQHFDILPDITTLAKGLGGGLPIGAFMVTDKLKDVMGASSHGTTFGMNPIVCAGANVVLKKVANDKFLKEVIMKGEKIRACLSLCPEVEDITGLGLMIGIKLRTKKSADVVKACLAKGLLVLTAKEKVRLLPPLTISDKELSEGIRILWDVLNQP
ncbi:MAG: aspartate aminotransferase family protein [Oscillospiraceae bacterium]|nr:aspartate aminotransferase family protein [Oscillospiraceae bacterium]